MEAPETLKLLWPRKGKINLFCNRRNNNHSNTKEIHGCVLTDLNLLGKGNRMAYNANKRYIDNLC